MPELYAFYFPGISDEVKKPEFAGGVTLQDGSCGGQWRYPRNCLPGNGTCEYSVQWTYKGKKVIFDTFPSCEGMKAVSSQNESNIAEILLCRI